MSKTKKKKDFQKVKLKVGKKLPRDQNVTNTSFKTRSIQVVQKLRGDNSEPSTHRKLNLKDLLSQCQHYNSSIRHEAVSGLKELTTLHPTLVPLHLAAILEKMSQLFTDKDPVVRQAVIRLLKQMFASVLSNQVAPFFPLLSAHLCCAMTHIYEDIQRDSLNIFDLLLETYPDLVTNNSTKILPNFIEQISRHYGTGHSKSNGNWKVSVRSLSIVPNSKISIHRWRAGVLSRLHRLLTAILTTSQHSSEPSEKEKNVFKWQAGVVTEQTFPSYLASSWITPGFVLSSDRSMITRNSQSLSSADGEYDVKKFADTLVPLLIECWIESRPVDDTSNVTGSVVPQNVLSMMITITSVIQLLWESLVIQTDVNHDDQTSAFLSSYYSDFEKHFMTSFPYAAHENLHKAKRAKQDFPVVVVESLNLAVCDIMSYFIGKSSISIDMSWISQVRSYIISCLKERHLDANQIKVVIKIINKLLVHSSSEGKDLLEEALQYYLTSHPLSTERKLLLHLFADQILNHLDSHFQCLQNIMERFLQSLPELLSLVIRDNEEMSMMIISVVKRAACQKCLPVFDTLQQVFISLMEPDSGTLVKCKAELQTRLLEILFWFPSVNVSLLKALCLLLLDDRVDASVCLYVIDIIHHRFLQDAGHTRVETSAYISFLLTLLTGVDSGKLSALCEEDHSQSLSLYRICWTVSPEKWIKHQLVVQHIMVVLNEFTPRSDIDSVMLHFWTKLVTDHKVVSILTVHAILITCRHLLSHDQTDQWQSLISNLCLSLACDLTSKRDLDDTVSAEDVVDLWTNCSECLSANSDVFSKFLEKTVEIQRSVSLEDNACTLTRVVTTVLQEECVQCCDKTTITTQLLHQFKNITQSKVPNVMEKQWWSDFMYQISL